MSSWRQKGKMRGGVKIFFFPTAREQGKHKGRREEKSFYFTAPIRSPPVRETEIKEYWGDGGGRGGKSFETRASLSAHHLFFFFSLCSSTFLEGSGLQKCPPLRQKRGSGSDFLRALSSRNPPFFVPLPNMQISHQSKRREEREISHSPGGIVVFVSPTFPPLIRKPQSRNYKKSFFVSCRLLVSPFCLPACSGQRRRRRLFFSDFRITSLLFRDRKLPGPKNCSPFMLRKGERKGCWDFFRGVRGNGRVSRVDAPEGLDAKNRFGNTNRTGILDS